MSSEAPSVTLDPHLSGTLDIAERLDRGELDLALGGLAAPWERICGLRSLEGRFACLLRKDQPVASESNLRALHLVCT